MRTLFFLIVFLFAVAACTEAPPPPAPEKPWIQLFNGKDLTGWTPKIRGYELGNNFGNTFRVEDGILMVSYDQYETFDERFGHLFYEKPFSNYRLRVEYRFVGEQLPDGPGWAFRNNGLMLHCQTPESMLLDQDFPVSIEAQILGGNGTEERTTCNLCTPGTHVEKDGKLITQHCINSTSKTFHGDQWVNVEFIVMGDSLFQHIAEGDTVLVYNKSQIGGSDLPEGFPLAQGTPLKEGYISIQSETHPTEFRKIELQELK
ncbi:MAG: DUF1080 domain-containing protein [Saprospiraceae bacterium]